MQNNVTIAPVIANALAKELDGNLNASISSMTAAIAAGRHRILFPA
jgi:hypothetical protein